MKNYSTKSIENSTSGMVAETERNPTKFQCDPVTFSSFSTISFSIMESSKVKFLMYDLCGKIVLNSTKFYTRGDHKLFLTRNDLFSGIYFLKMITDDEPKLVKLMIK